VDTSRATLNGSLAVLCLLLLAGCNSLFDGGDDDDASNDDDLNGDDDAGDDDSAQAITQTWTLSFPAEGLARIELENSLGEISLSGSAGATNIEVLATLHGEAGAEPLATLPIEVTDLEAALTLTIEPPQGLEGARIDLLVSAPDDMTMGLSGGDYPLSVVDMRAGGGIASTGGTITGLGLSGNFEVSGGDASILLGLELVPGGSLTASLDSGPIELDLPADTSAMLTATATGGAVEISGLSFEGVVVDGQGQGTLGSGDGSISLSTSEADIRLRGHGPPEAEGN